MRRLGRVRAVSFDVDDTLWDFTGVMRRSLALALEELRRHVPAGVADDLDVDAMIRIRDGVAEELKGRASLEQIRLAGFERTLAVLGRPDAALAAHLNALYVEHRHGNIALFSDVLSTLDVLRRRYALGLISNGNTDPNGGGIAGYWSFAVFAPDHGVEKPDPGLFEIALRAVGCEAGELVHVGDSWTSDVQGAIGVGARAVWLNRNGASAGAAMEDGVAPDAVIATLAELPAWLADF